MGIAQTFKAEKFTDREIPDVGPVRIRHIKTKEMLELTDEKDNNVGLRKAVLLCVYEGDAPAFKSIEEVNEIDWLVIKPLVDAVRSVNKLNLKDAEKNSGAPPSAA